MITKYFLVVLLCQAFESALSSQPALPNDKKISEAINSLLFIEVISNLTHAVSRQDEFIELRQRHLYGYCFLYWANWVERDSRTINHPEIETHIALGFFEMNRGKKPPLDLIEDPLGLRRSSQNLEGSMKTIWGKDLLEPTILESDQSYKEAASAFHNWISALKVSSK